MSRTPAISSDIRYRGPLSYRGLRIIALLLMTISGLAGILQSVGNLLGMDALKDMIGNGVWMVKPLTVIGQMSFPLLLISTFSRITQKRNAILRAMLGYFIASAILYLLIILFLQQYIAAELVSLYDQAPKLINGSGKIISTIANNLLNSVDDTVNPSAQVFRMILSFLPEGIREMLPSLARLSGSLDLKTLELITARCREAFMASLPQMSSSLSHALLTQIGNVNVFLDLFLCSLFYFFTFYKPRNLKGGKLLLFRLCTAIPVEYVFLSFVLIGLCKIGNIRLPLQAMALFTYRKPAAFIIFLAMCIYLKFKEVNSTEKGLSEEEHLRCMSTNLSSLRYSIFLCAVLLVISGCEFLFYKSPITKSWRLGTNYWMFLAIPIVLLYSYSRTTKHKWPDKVIVLYYPIHYAIIIGAWVIIISYFLIIMLGDEGMAQLANTAGALRNIPAFRAFLS